ncbi:unnamed protein product [Fraxinus pennsylvanica]|uniref:Pentatricopeptide repeat-containing protein n=1 Tax=Fraxinus pennsylvanica TaxID=56036 RepID=A0AAD1ZRQ9_9LAMI|nr:unnamed protein product [Fraxinus pennsylvanica]
MPERDGFAWSTMIEAHEGVGDLASEKSLFDEITEKNIAAWNTMIHGYVRVSDVNSAEKLFFMMLEKDLISWTMIHCYAKSKQFSNALDLFYELKNEVRPDEVTMSTVISARAHLAALNQREEVPIYAMQSGQNLHVYIRMEKNIKPNGVTFASNLSACTHAGLVEEG